MSGLTILLHMSVHTEIHSACFFIADKEVINSGRADASPRVITHNSDPLTHVAVTIVCTTSNAIELHKNTHINATMSHHQVIRGFINDHSAI
jgi:hypothetical protein